MGPIRLSIAVGLALTMAGCANPQHVAQAETACDHAGAPAGSPERARCVLRVVETIRSGAHDRASLADAAANVRAEHNQPSARPRYTETSVCWREGHLTNCNP